MICSTSVPRIRRRSGEGPKPRGFTLVELLTVILILAILIALLLPAINAAVRTAKNAAVGGDINQLAQALAAFKNQYGDYPPSRIYLSEDGNLLPNPAGGSNSQIAAGDITYAQLGQRTIAAMRKFFPRATFNLGTATGKWYDFNGDGYQVNAGKVTQQYILQGHECLVFFLGGIVQNTGSGYAMTGFGKDPTNPFTNNIVGNAGYSGNRQTPFYQFVANRLALDPNNTTTPHIPGYLDSLGNETLNPIANALTGLTDYVVDTSAGMLNFYAYFSSYGNNGYDPNDVNFASEVQSSSATSAALEFHVGYPIQASKTGNNYCVSLAPNPYTSSLTLTTSPTTFLNPQSFQIISSGIDGNYGVAGQYLPDLNEALPYDLANNPYVNNALGGNIRAVEHDNISNFHNGKLE